MNILLLSYGVYEYDGRLRELIKAAKMVGDVTYVTRVSTVGAKQECNHKVIVGGGPHKYIVFILKCILVAMRMGKDFIIFVDNRKAVIPGLFINTIIRNKLIIQDVRELYLMHEIRNIKGKIGCFFERKLIKKASVVICANKYRAKIMKEHFFLKEMPLVFENIRRLKFKNHESKKQFTYKHLNYFKNNNFRIVSTSGCDIDRGTDKLVLALGDLGEKFQLFLVGCCNKKDRDIISKIIKDNGIKNVHLMGKVKEDELKYLIQQCHLGVVSYNKKDKNNEFCASGKIYEYIFEELPVITTDNVPLVEICTKYQIGLSDNDHLTAIKGVTDNYNFFKRNVKRLASNLDAEKNNYILAFKLGMKIKQYL